MAQQNLDCRIGSLLWCIKLIRIPEQSSQKDKHSLSALDKCICE